MVYSNIFPAPGDLINRSGLADNINGLPAPGFKGVSLQYNQSVGIQRSRSNRGLSVSEDNNFWSFNIEYNEMTDLEYEAIESFLLSHNAKVNPFYVTLPNYSQPKTLDFSRYQQINPLVAQGTYYAGDSQITIESTNTDLLPGCFINFVDPEDALHKSIYKISRVETSEVYAGSPPNVGTMRISIFPFLQRDLSLNCPIRFTKPLFRVIQTSNLVQEVDKNNITTFSMSCQEILP